MAGDVLTPPPLPAAPFVKTFTCQGCGGNVNIRAIGQSMTVICSSCGTAVDALDENFKVIAKFKSREGKSGAIPLGSRGKLHGTTWECIGHMVRSDTKIYYWSEYLLFNPTKGFRWLTENSGHWTWIKITKDLPTDYKAEAEYLGKSYKLFHQGPAEVEFVTGEFYWRVKEGDKSYIRDFIRPPEILSHEVSGFESNWAVGEYIHGSTIQKAFNLKLVPSTSGVAPNQPWDVTNANKDILSWWFYFCAVLVGLQIFHLLSAENKIVSSEHYAHYVGGPFATTKYVSKPFVLGNETANLELKLSANVDNDWLETSVELVNDDTGLSQEYEIGAEFYSGYDYDGRWSEGSQNNSYLIPSVPGGNYHLNIESSGGSRPGSTYFKIEAVRDTIEWSNFLWCFSLISFLPLFIIWRRRAFEINRWENSDYSPYHGAEG